MLFYILASEWNVKRLAKWGFTDLLFQSVNRFKDVVALDSWCYPLLHTSTITFQVRSLQLLRFVASKSEVYQLSYLSLFIQNVHAPCINIHPLLCVWHWPNIKSQGHSVKMSFQVLSNKSTQTNYSRVNDASVWWLWELGEWSAATVNTCNK